MLERIREFHTVGANIRELRSPNWVRVRGITRSPRIAERRLVRPGAAVVTQDHSARMNTPIIVEVPELAIQYYINKLILIIINILAFQRVFRF